MSRYDVIVIGAGIAGLAVAHGLRRRDAASRIAVLERFAGPAPARGSSHGLLRIIRSAYPTILETSAMRRCFLEWRRLEQDIGGPLIRLSPMCLYGAPSGVIADYAAAIEKVHAGTTNPAIRRIDACGARRLFPQFAFDDDAIVLEDRTAGILFASEIIRRLAETLARARVELRYDTQVLEIERESGGYRVHTDGGALRAHRLVVAAGPWTGGLVPCPAGRITPIRQTVAYVRVSGLPTGTAVGAFPPWAHVGDGANPIHYGLPAFAPQGLKVARHVTEGPATDPEPDDADADPAEADRLVDFVRSHLNVTGVELLGTERCMYTCGRDDRFILDWLDDSRRGIVLGAGSGHMFKWAPVDRPDGDPDADRRRAGR